jgi:hypothetical protein
LDDAPGMTTSALKRTHPCPISFGRPHMVLASRVYGSPSNGFWLAPFTFTDSPDHAGVSRTIRDIALRAHLAAARAVSHNRKLVH